MEQLAVLPDTIAYEAEPRVRLLVADDDPLARSLLAACVREIADGIVVLEAEDGAEAIQLGLQQRPEIALLDVNMPRLGGIEAAITLRELRPELSLALHTADPLPHRERVQALGLTLFGKLELDRTLAWLHAEVEAHLGWPALYEAGSGTRDSSRGRSTKKVEPACGAERTPRRPSIRRTSSRLT